MGLLVMYDKICNFGNLLAAFKAVKKNNNNDFPIVKYFFRLENNLLDLRSKLLDQSFTTKPYKRFIVTDPKRREISAPHFEDRIVQHALVTIIEPIFEKVLIDDAYACRIKKGTHFALKRVKKFLQASRCYYGKNHDIYVMKCDVRKFFSSISWDVLLEIVAKKITDTRTMDLIRKIVTNYSVYITKEKLKAYQQSLFETITIDPVSVVQRKGLPIGNLTSQLFANVYMNELDQFVKHKLKEKWYGRYMDDFFIISGDKNRLLKEKIIIDEFLKTKLKLSLHPKKSLIQNTKDGVCFVGYRIFYDHILIRGSTLRRFQKKYAMKVRKYKLGKLDEKKLRECRTSFQGHLKHANAYKLNKMMFKNEK